MIVSRLSGISLIVLFGLLSACSSGYQYVEEGLDTVLKRYKELPDFTVLLADMDYRDDKYLHQYELLIPDNDSSFRSEETEWYEVSAAFFEKHQGALGMEVAHKENGVVTKRIVPPGYSAYVGNEKYGQWVNRGGSSFWEFYGKYALLSSILNMGMYRTPYSSWSTFDRSYRGANRDYYGPSGTYGTARYVQSDAGKNTQWGKKPQTFREKVRSRVSQSGKNQRSRSRYSRSSSRSRSGGFGK